MPRMRVCAEPGCPEIQATPRCPTHTRQVDRARGTRQQRGYGQQHVKLRETWKRKVNRGGVRCARCDRLIPPGSAFHLDHAEDRTSYLGASCVPCNTSAGGKAAHQ